MAISSDLVHLYRKFRQHQMDVYAAGGGVVTHYPNGRTEHSYGSAAYGQHAYAAFMSARRNIHFRKTLAEDIKASRKRSRAAKRGWKTRKANQS